MTETMEQLIAETFLPHVGEVFHVIVSDTHELRVALTEVARLPGGGLPPLRSEPFALVFHAKAGATLPQGMYRMEHPALHPFDCFLVPLGPDDHGVRFEAIYT